MIKGKVHHVSNTINKLTSTITMSLYFTKRSLVALEFCFDHQVASEKELLFPSLKRQNNNNLISQPSTFTIPYHHHHNHHHQQQQQQYNNNNNSARTTGITPTTVINWTTFILRPKIIK